MTTKKTAVITIDKKNTGFYKSLYLLVLLTLIAFSSNALASSIKDLKRQQIDEILFNTLNIIANSLSAYIQSSTLTLST